MKTNPTSTQAKIAPSVVIGAHSIIDDGVEIGAHTVIGHNVVIKKGTTIGETNHIYSGAQIGIEPQDYHFKNEDSHCIIGNNNIIREYATISRATGEGNKTIIGNNNFIMTYVHIGHNCIIGNDTIIASGTQVGGHVEIHDRANVGGLSGIHQFCRIGTYAMLGAKSYLNKDLPPFLLASGNRARIYGVNTKGLLRCQFSWQEIDTIKDLFRTIYLESCDLTTCLDILKKKPITKFRDELITFIESSQRGILGVRSQHLTFGG
jgi:UDP-N-acetylglucosamine acyltransferase